MKLTVFTPTYNRANYLNRVYESLMCQSNKDFEWLVVDDGSTDDTDSIINSLVEKNQIDIRYIKKENGGKHTAHNLALEYATGDYFVCLDSDDVLAHDAVENIMLSVHKLNDSDSGLLFCKSEMTGTLLNGDVSIVDGFHMGLYQLTEKYGIRGEFTFVFKTVIAKENPFPVVRDEKFIGECVLYDALELKGYTWCICNKVVEICEYQVDGLSNRFYELLWNNPLGYVFYHRQRIELVTSIKEKVQHAVRYNAFSKMARLRGNKFAKSRNFYNIITWLPGQILVIYYYMKIKKGKI